MANPDPDLAAQLLAAFSAPAQTGALPVADFSSLSYDEWQWDNDQIADLLLEQKSEPQTDPAPVQPSQDTLPLPQGTLPQKQPSPETSQPPQPSQPLQPENIKSEPLSQDHLQHEPQQQQQQPQQPLLQEQPKSEPSTQLSFPPLSAPPEPLPQAVSQHQQLKQEAAPPSAQSQEPSPRLSFPPTPAPQAATSQERLGQQQAKQEVKHQLSLPQTPVPQQALPREPSRQLSFPPVPAPQATTSAQVSQQEQQHPTEPPTQVSLPQATAAQNPLQENFLQQNFLRHDILQALQQSGLTEAQQPAVPEAPSSTRKRSRSRTPVAENHEDTSEKRLKADHHNLEHRDVDLSAANWDISAMIQNALGSFDEQVNQPHNEQHNEAGQEPGNEPRQGRPQAPKKVEQKRMKFASNPYYVMRTMSLPLLGSLAIQILLALSQQSREETVALMADDESEFRKAYDTLKTALGHARRIFSEGSPLLFADELDISDSEDRETIRMSNLAAISTSAFSGDGSLLADVHDNFPTIFVPEEGDFVKDLKPLYLDFKTQSMLYSLTTVHTPQERSDVLDRFFPPNFDDLLTQRHGDSLFQSNREDLVSEVGTRRQALLESILDDEKRQRLKNEYPINGFLDSLVDYLQSHLTMVIDYAEKYGINIPVSEESVVNEPLENGGAHDDHDELSALLQSATAKLLDGMDMDGLADSASDTLGLGKLIQESLQNHAAPVKDEGPESNSNAGGLLESGGLASLIASKLTDFDQFANSSNAIGNEVPQHGLPQVTQASMQSAYTAQYNQMQQTQYYGYGQPPPPPQPPADGSNLPPNQTFPTSVLYERARQAAVAKSSSAARREGIHSTRRAWTPEEEKALMAGLDLVKGPHWSQILSLFGANGSISDILKDRTQVQLKDKARNLKLFFLKTNSEMPYYLQCVTGELKTRAPGQAARKEAEEKARQNSEEEQARLQGIMTLAGGLQHNHPQVSSSMTAQHTPAYARTTPMTPHANSAQLNRGMHTPITPQTTLAPATPGMQQRTPITQGFSGAPMVSANMSSMSTAAPRTPSMGTGTSNNSTGAQVTPNIGAGGGTVSYSSVSAPPQPSTTATTPASPLVKSEPQEQPVLIQPRPLPQPIRPAEPAGITNGFQQQQQQQQVQQPHQQQPQPQVHRPSQQGTPAPAAPQPRMQLTFPPAPSTPSHMQSSQPVSPARPQSHAPTPVPERVQSSTPAPHTPYHSLPHTPYQSHHTSPAPTPTPVAANHDHVGDLAQLANYQAPEQHTPQQQHYQQNNQQSYQTNGNRSSNEHHESHDQHNIHHDPEPNADMTLLQTLQAALAAAPSG